MIKLSSAVQRSFQVRCQFVVDVNTMRPILNRVWKFSLIPLSRFLYQEGSTALSIAMERNFKDIALLIYGNVSFDPVGKPRKVRLHMAYRADIFRGSNPKKRLCIRLDNTVLYSCF